MKIKSIYIALLVIFILTGCNTSNEISNNSSVESKNEENLENYKEDSDIAADTDIDQNNNNIDIMDIEEESDKISEEISDSDTLVIKEKMFITQINDIFFNFDTYKDKTIIVEGMYSVFTSLDQTQKVNVVYRNGPGCCENDGWGGFLLKYDGELPNENDWIQVTGTPELITEGDYKNLYLNVTNMTIMDERGAEFVSS